MASDELKDDSLEKRWPEDFFPEIEWGDEEEKRRIAEKVVATSPTSDWFTWARPATVAILSPAIREIAEKLPAEDRPRLLEEVARLHAEIEDWKEMAQSFLDLANEFGGAFYLLSETKHAQLRRDLEIRSDYVDLVKQGEGSGRAREKIEGKFEHTDSQTPGGKGLGDRALKKILRGPKRGGKRMDNLLENPPESLHGKQG